MIYARYSEKINLSKTETYMSDNKNKGKKISRAEIARALQIAVVVLSGLAVILGALCAVLYFSTPRLTIEAGESITPQNFVRDSEAVFGEDFDPDCINRAGVYYFTVISGDKHIEVRLRVKDTTPPDVELKDLLWAMGTPAPAPEDFIKSADEVGHFTGEYIEALPEIKRPGRYEAKIRFTDEWGNKTEVYTVAVEVISDTVPPEVRVLGDATFVIGGEKPDYSHLIAASDNCVGKVAVDKIDDSGVKYDKKGKYTVNVTVSDASKNKTVAKVTVYVVEAGENE